VKKVVLPSGKTIEVVYFAESVEAAKSSMPPKAEPDQIFTCLDCGSELVQPIEWQEAGPANWTVLLHCPNCDIYREGVFSQACVEAFDEVLDDGADALTRDYKRILRANLAGEIEVFVAALKADAILPEDF
jgi:transcription elongation factor Elf1